MDKTVFSFSFPGKSEASKFVNAIHEGELERDCFNTNFQNDTGRVAVVENPKCSNSKIFAEKLESLASSFSGVRV